MKNIKATKYLRPLFALAALGVGGLVAGCAPLPPCPRSPDNPVIVANANETVGMDKTDATDGGVLNTASNQKAKDIGVDRGPDTGAEARVREGSTEKEVTQVSKTEAAAPANPQVPPACKP